MPISAIVPVWNGRALLLRLLGTLAAQTMPVSEILAIDNGSQDGAPEAARERGARVVPMGYNAGFAAAVNRGVKESRGDWIAVLNSDVELAPDYLAKLLAAAESANAWFATGKILSASARDRIDGTFDLLCRGGTAWRVGSGRSDGGIFAKERSIWSPPFTAVLLRSELFRRTGVLETCFESYLEDVDFGLRCAAQNLAGIYVPHALAWHQGSAALGRWHPDTVRRMARNQIFLVARHYPDTLVHRWLWPILIAHLLWGGLALRHGRLFAWLLGVVQGMRNYSSVRKSCTVLDAAALENLLGSNEHLMRDFQISSGFDFYWRLYFLLTRGGAK